MRKYLGYVLAAGLAFGTSAYAQYPTNPTADHPNRPKTSGSTEQTQDVKTKTDNKTTTTSADTITGKVLEYKAGNSIEVSTPGKTEGSKTFDLNGKDLTVNVASSL